MTASLGKLKKIRSDSFWKENFSQCGNDGLLTRRRRANSQLDCLRMVLLMAKLALQTSLFKRLMLSIFYSSVVEIKKLLSKAKSFFMTNSDIFLDHSHLNPY